MNPLRRYEILVPLLFNDGSPEPCARGVAGANLRRTQDQVRRNVVGDRVLAPEFTGGLSGDSPGNSAKPAAAPISAPTAPTGRKSLRTPPRSTRAFRA